jgi:hypothetical protein
MICHSFMLNQQQQVKKLKYIADKGYAILDEADTDNIINAATGADIYDTMLGQLDKEQRITTTSKCYDSSAIIFSEAKEGAVEALRPTTFLLKPPSPRSPPKTWMTV